MPETPFSSWFPLRGAVSTLLFLSLFPIGAQRMGAAQPSASELSTEVRDNILSNKRPRLIVFLSVDQLRSDHLTRLGDQFAINGGLRRLMRDGAYLADAHYSHVPTATGPGHSVMLSGARLAETGIVGNDWVTSTGKRQYCVEDERFAPVGIPAGLRRGGSASPLNMRAETVGDVMKANFPGLSRTVGIAIKDRASILMTGKNPDACTWFDDNSGRWISSTYYGTTLPLFVQKANQEQLSHKWLKSQWDLRLPRDAYNRSHGETVTGINNGDGMGTTFPLILAADGAPSRQYFKRLTVSPFGNEMVFDMARLAVIEMDLGRRNYHDLLALNFSSVDYTGHSYGPNSPHMQDMILRLDAQLGEFMSFLESRLASEDVLFVLTADHGVSPLPEWYGEVTAQDTRRLPWNRVTDEAVQAISPLVREAVDKAVAAGTPLTTTSAEGLIAGWNSTFLTLHGPRMKELNLNPAELRQLIVDRLSELDLIEYAGTRDDIIQGRMHNKPFAQHIINGFHEDRSGDVVVIPRPWVQITNFAKGTNHITPYNYDTHVPILFMGRGIRSGWSYKRADVRDIAPTISALLGQVAPAQSTGQVLDQILK